MGRLDKQTLLQTPSSGFGVTCLVLLWFQNSWALDNLALLAGTLRTHQRNVCNQHSVVLNCPAGTCISVQMAQYVKSTPNVCPNAEHNFNLTCLWPPGLQSVVEKCQKKRQCKLYSSPQVFNVEPCPGNAKYIEITYKCRPYEFHSKLTCQDEGLHIRCNPNSRLAVYSASFGRTEYETVRCPQPQGVIEETCLVSYATETVMKLCHGKRQCNLSADVSTFGSPCQQKSRMYLKVVYTCVPRKVLVESYETPLLDDETDLDFNDDVEDFIVRADVIREEEVYSESPNLAVAGRRLNGTGGETPNSPVQNGRDDTASKYSRVEIYLLIGFTACTLILLPLLVKLIWEWKCNQTVADSTIQKIYTEELNHISSVVNDPDVQGATIVSNVLPMVPTSNEIQRAEIVHYEESNPAVNFSSDIGIRYYYGWQLPSEDTHIVPNEDNLQILPQNRTYTMRSE